jgi:hypothetical protein
MSAESCPAVRLRGRPARSRCFLALGFAGALLLLPAAGSAATPIRIHPEHPHLFEWRGRTTVLVGSTEHYGAVLNLDFDYRTYLDTIHAAGLNLTRIVPGTTLESTTTEVWRGHDQNPLAPRPGRYLAPWVRSATPGAGDGGNKFDLDRWDDKFFARLRDFVHRAGERGIVVEVTLLYVLYGEGPADGNWVLHPLNARNNINGIGRGAWHRYNTLDDPALVARQEAVVRKIVSELNPFDNVIHEICDEPYLSGASPAETEAWQNRMLDAFDAVRRSLPHRQLVAINPANLYAKVEAVHPAVDWVNFHYSSPPAAAPMNYHLNKPLGFDETPGNQGANALPRRREAWAWMFSGGALYNNLDPSFATDDPTGSGRVQQHDGTFDGREVRTQLRALRNFMDSLDLVRMRPTEWFLQHRPQTPKVGYALAAPGRQYAVYIPRGGRLARFMADLPAGRWRAEWILPRDGHTLAEETFRHEHGAKLFESPKYPEDVALRLTLVP